MENNTKQQSIKFLKYGVCFIMGALLTLLVGDYMRLKSKEQELASTPRKIEKEKEKEKASDPFTQMQKRIDQIFDKPFLGGTSLFGTLSNGLDLGSDMGVTISEREDEEYKYVDVIGEGLDQEGLNIDIRDGQLNISGEIRKESKNQDQGSWGSSSFISSFKRSFPVPPGVDPDKVQFDSRPGRVVIKFPKRS